MAKVYSWEVSNSPKKYAYIVHPDDYNKAYVGTELKGTKLEKVKDWAAVCTDTQYEAQFNKMVALCKSKGYNVEFETAIAYMDIESTCDNLRGPAGRGIDHITLKDVDEFRNVSIYEIVYDDGETDTFEIRNGKDGQNGRDGRDGAQGDAGVSSKLIMIYTSGVDSFGNTFTPARPTGGSYDFDTYEFTRPDEGVWNLNDSDLTPPIWMSSRTFSSSPASTDKEWSLPVQLTGESGKPGVDGVSTEFIYYRDKNEPNVESLDSPNEAGYVPPKETGWTASPQGVDEDNPTEWASTRKLDRATNVWGKWSKAFRWSQYGVNGQDGDGIQYIYLKNAGQIVENPTPANYKTNENYQNRDNEWVPTAGVTYTNINGVQVKYSALEERTDDLAPAGIWTDNPSDLTANFHSQWVCSRKYRKGSDGKMAWDKFSDPALWARYGQDGKNATSIRKLYALSSDTKTYPPIPEDTTATSEWGSGFPKDYEVGVNVVWAIEAEIWAHNFEFVKTYKIVSGVDEDGNVVPPADATMSNTIDVQSIPNEEVKGYDYIRLNGDYYAWSGGWGTPYIVTGVKGENGEPINYTTYVYAFGYTNYPPEAPTGTSPKYPGESTDGIGSRILWYDFPNSNVGMDGYIDPSNNQEMRWYQCVGYVNGRNGEVESWSDVQPCNGHDGTAGPQGNRTEVRFGVTADSIKPILVQKDETFNEIKREPELYDSKGNKMGWFATDEKLPEVPPGGTMWQIWALIDGATDTVIVQDGRGWNGPVRVSGEKGEQGIQGPAGMRGVTGIPGATSIQMYCLGTYGKDEKSESYWETGGIDGGDGYFGGDNWKNNALIDDMDGWFIAKDMPYSNILKVYDLDQLNTVSRLEENIGRVVNLIEASDVNVGATGSESTFTHTTHTYYLISKDGDHLRQLTPALDPSEEFNVYVWCIQGNEIWQAGSSSKYVNITKFDNDGNVIPPEDATSDNTVVRNDVPAEEDILYKYILCNNNYYEWKEIDGDRVTHVLTGIEWGSPFKLQGTNGLRGLSGTRGQVVYPMGVYNSEEVYITTEDKAPYVYDPNDGMYYVYNNTERPWLGRRPGYDPSTGIQGDLYKTILVHPDDAESNFIVIDYDPLTASEIFGYKYVYYKDKYYTWNGSKYVMASKYKYSIDGSGADGTWIPDQHGDAPANNYANAINADETPQWVRFESFKALYTSIGIIENGLVGSAVFNNEFMFSQQGVDKNEQPTNYAVVSGRDTSYGFLSGYKYDEKGKINDKGEVLHWYYAGTDNYINEFEVNPYEKDGDGKYIHTFMPNVCINFATGQMWLSTGRIQFGKLNDRNVSTTSEMQKEISDASDALSTVIEANRENLQNQIDKSATTYYQANDPSIGWQNTNSKALTTYAPERIGDLWFNTSKNKSYVFAQTTGGIPQVIKDKGTYLNSQNNTLKNAGYYWVESDVPESVYNRINSRSKIFVEKPTTPYYVGDLWFLESDSYKTEKFYNNETGMNKGTCMVCLVSRESGNCVYTEWGKRDKYADEADVIAAQKELDAMNTQLDNWASDHYISPVERLALKDEYNTVVAEYESIIAQATTCGLGSSTECTNYKNAYTAAKRTFEYYIDITKVESGTDCIKILTTGNYAYSNLKTYYEKRQLLLQKISDTLNANITNGLKDVRSEFAVADNEIKATVSTLETTIDGKLKEVKNSILTNEDVAGIVSQELIDGKVITEASITTYIEDGISNATIKADKVNIGGDVNINDILTVDNNMVSMSNATIEDCHIEDCTITNVTIEGSLRSPFVLDDNTGTVDSTLHDNIVCHMVDSNATAANQAVAYPYALQWDKSQNGRKVTIANGLWEHTINGTEESVGIIRINAPTTENIKVNFENTTWGSIQDTITNLPEGLKSGEYKAYTIRRNPDSDASFNFWLNQTAYIKIPPGVKTYTFYARRLLATTANNPSPKQAVNNSYTGTVIDRPVINTGEILPIQPVPGTDCDTLTITLPNGKTKTAAQSEYWTKIEVTVLDQKVGCTVTVTHARSAATTYNTSTAQIIVPDLINTGCFFEDGIQKDHIILSREIVELTGFGSPDKFYGWVVTNRTLLNPKLNYGCQVKALLSGTVRYVYDSGSKKYVARPSLSSPYARYNSDGVIIGSGFQEYSDGKYAIIMSDTQIVDWKKIFDASTTMIMVTGIGPILNSDRNGYGKNPAKACVAQRTAKYKKDSSATSGYTYNDSGNTNWPGFEIWISDDTTTNPAGFNFIIFSTLESFGILDK